MAYSKNEVNLLRLIASAPRQSNQAKLVHYVATLRELLETIAAETTSEGLPTISKAKIKDYSEKIEAIASKVDVPTPSLSDAGDVIQSSLLETPQTEEVNTPGGLRRRFGLFKKAEDREEDVVDRDSTAPIKLDAATQAHIEKHRKLQEDLTDDMVLLAQQLKENSLMMNQSVKNTEKILDSTERAVEHSLAGTDRANAQAMAVFSEGSKTTCCTWLLILVMSCVFVMVVLLIRVT